MQIDAQNLVLIAVAIFQSVLMPLIIWGIRILMDIRDRLIVIETEHKGHGRRINKLESHSIGHRIHEEGA